MADASSAGKRANKRGAISTISTHHDWTESKRNGRRRNRHPAAQQPKFHVPDDDRPLLLIGNGTGIAGLRALLKLGAQRGHHRNWLLFGERHHQHDFFYGDALEAWRAGDAIERLDLAFSRDGEAKTYVQHLLLAAAAEVRAWVQAGAWIHVCGNLQGMAPGVDAALADILGNEALETLAAEGRYRRDVY